RREAEYALMKESTTVLNVALLSAVWWLSASGVCNTAPGLCHGAEALCLLHPISSRHPSSERSIDTPAGRSVNAPRCPAVEPSEWHSASRPAPATAASS